MSDKILVNETLTGNNLSEVTGTRLPHRYKTALDVISSGGGESATNSSTELLTNGSTFTGEWEDVSNYDSIIVALKTDQDGLLTVQYSPDGTNIDSSLTRYYRTSQIEPPHRFTNTRMYYRVLFENNSGSDQTYFRLQTMLKVTSQNLNIPVDSTMSQDYDAISTRPTDYTTEVALGRRQGSTTWNKFGYNEDVDAASAEIIASYGGTHTHLTSGETLDIVSDSTDDTNSSGTGLRLAVIYGVDSNWDEVIEVIAMNGTTTVTSINSYLGVNRLTIYTSGSSESNVGTITATATTSGNTMAQMPAGQGTTQQCIFYIPRNHQFITTWLYLSAIKSSGGGNPSVTFKGYVYSDVVQSKFEVYRDSIDTSGGGERIELKPAEPFIIGEKSILWFEAETTSNNTSVRGRFSGKLIGDADR